MTTTLEHDTQTLAPLREHERNAHSQFGEDGIIEEILRRLGELDRPADRPLWCVEFGAWDGVHLSNTRHLIETHDAHAVLIEPCEERHRQLVDNTAEFPGVTTINSVVDSFGERTLDALLAGTDCPERFDVLSIDIDGHDFWVWHALRKYEPLIVVVEYNPTIPYRYDYPTPRDPAQRHGSSLSALERLGAKKGYALVAVTQNNAVFVRQRRAPELRLHDTCIEALTEHLTDYRTFLFATPDGRVRLTGNRVMMWHSVLLDEEAMQPLPPALRKHHDALGPIGRTVLKWLERRSRKRYERQLAREQQAWDDWAERIRRPRPSGTP